MKYILYVVFLTYYYIGKHSCSDKTSNTLKLVQILFRHGDRAPTELYPNDPHTDWPDGLGQLTKKGKNQMYDLGSKLRKLYGNFLSEYYKPDKIQVTSSYADRCLMSAQLVLAGLFPPVKEQIWNSHLLWQPIPVKYLPRKLDNLIALKMDCPVYDSTFKWRLDSNRIKKINEENKDLYKYLSEGTGKNISNIGDVELLYNTLVIEVVNNLTLPSWTKNVSFDVLHTLAAQNLALYTDNLLMKRLKGGVLLKEIVNRMINKSENILKPDLDLVLYSGHDLTIVTLARTIGLEKLLKPDYGAALIFELHLIEGVYEVRVLYSGNYLEYAKPWHLEFCLSGCTLDDFTKGLEPVLPVKWNEECAAL